MRSTCLGAILILALLVHGNARAQSDALYQEIRALVDTVETASWTQTSWEQLGERQEYTAARCLWAGQHSMRLDVFEGRGSGATAILFEGRVYGFKRGLLSFIKRSFEPAEPRVVSLRGNPITTNGFMDDLDYVLKVWETVSVVTGAEGAPTLRYVDEGGLSSTLELARDPVRVTRHRRLSGTELIELYTYSDVRYNPPLDGRLLSP